MTTNNNTALAPAFTDFKTQLEQIKANNSALVFNYEDKQGAKDARAHIAELRKSKTALTMIHKDAKADILEAGRLLDGGKNTLMAELDAMILIHDTPLKAIKAREDEIKRRAAEEAARIAQAEENERLYQLAHEQALIDNDRFDFDRERQQEELKRQARIDADREHSERLANEKAARIQAENQLKNAEEDARQAAEYARREERAKHERLEKMRLADEQRLQQEAAAKAANKEHRRAINVEILTAMINAGVPKEHAITVIQMAAKGQAGQLTINY